tara:strand:+ start:297 stop:758 length:462 start_codon:yes stop_codon:yes gene_type:complete
MSLAEFEARMLKLKGVKLPAVSLIGTEVSKYANNTIVATPNRLVDKVLKDIDDDKVSQVESLDDSALDDILVGIVRSFAVADSHKGNKLNVSVVRSILHKLPVISTNAIAVNFGYSRSQAKLYAQACRLVIQFKSRHDVRQSFNTLAKFSEEL